MIPAREPTDASIQDRRARADGPKVDSPEMRSSARPSQTRGISAQEYRELQRMTITHLRELSDPAQAATGGIADSEEDRQVAGLDRYPIAISGANCLGLQTTPSRDLGRLARRCAAIELI